MLQGNTLVGVQGVFLVTNPLPIHPYDTEDQMVQLVNIARKRV